jgi:Fur family zinc uptake transcriptional regulator
LVRPTKGGVIAPPAVYRSLEFLLAQGLVHRLETSRAYVACDHPDHEHDVQFLICRQCGTAVETEDARIANAAHSLGDRVGFHIEQLAVEITGVCSNCRL